MLENFRQLLTSYGPWDIAIEIIVIWLGVYVAFRFLRGTRGIGVIKGLTITVMAAAVIMRLLAHFTDDAFTRLNFLFDRFLGLLAVLLIVVFQPELRQAMSRLGVFLNFRGAREGTPEAIAAVAQAVEFLSKNQFGALIAFERGTRLGTLVAGGVELDANVDARLLESIFWPNSPLHDLGVVIRDDRIVAASVQFPLIEEGAISSQFGSRHRAAAGLSDESDALIVIVSEETGAISIAEHGHLDHNLPRDKFERILQERLAAEPTLPAPETSDVPTRTSADEQDPDEKRAA